MNIIPYEKKKLILYDKVILKIISLKKNIINPINIAINSILKKFSFLLNLAEKPKTIKPSITKNRGFKICDK